MPFGIYSITNVVTGDMYIGQTIQDFKKRWKSHISTNDYTSILAIKAKYSKKVTPKKTIKAINIKDNSEEIIEGIGVCARKLDIPRKSIEKVLQGKQKTTYGYAFAYI